MTEFLQHLVNGLSVGTIYALIALGYTMVYGVLKLINFAHGDVFMVGAFIGVPLPIVGSIAGAFAGAFIGAFVFEWSRELNHGTATRVAWGALLGRVIAAAVKVAIGLAMAVWMIWAVLV